MKVNTKRLVVERLHLHYTLCCRL